jgi:hypothetical protein
MPVVDMIKTSNEGNLIFYDVEASVGRNGMNNRTDVLLVQFLLASALTNPNFQAAGPPGPIQANGIPDQPTLDGILFFQTVLRQQSVAYATVDGRFDPVPGVRPSTRNRVQYGMVMLNMAFDAARPGELSRLVDLTDCPGDLRSLLRVRFIESG